MSIGPAKAVALIANAAPWPPTNGATVRQFYMLKELHSRGLKVEVFAFCEDRFIDEARVELAKLADGVHLAPKSRAGNKLAILKSLLQLRPLTEGNYQNAALQTAVNDFFERHPNALALVHSSNVATWVPAHRRNVSVLDMADLDSAKFVDFVSTERFPMNAVFAYEAWSLARAERQLMHEFVATTFVTPREIEAIDAPTRERFASRLHFVPNGVDSEKFTARQGEVDLSKVPESERRFFAPGRRVLFTGAMDYLPNVQAVELFAREMFPTLKREFTDLRFTIMGARPTPAVQALTQIEGVEVTGFVDDAVPYFQTAEVVVIPITVARGIQNKALEAMACGCAVVTFPVVALGVNGRDGETLRAPSGNDDFIAAVRDLLLDRSLAASLGANARAHVANNYQWPKLMRELIDLMGVDQAPSV